MKNIIFFFTLLLITISLNSQVNFEFDFGFEKIAPNDELKNLQLFDYDEDNTDELFVGYNCENVWKLVCYNLNGDTLFTYSQSKLPNEIFDRFYLYRDDEVSLIISTSIIEGLEMEVNDSLYIQIIDLENNTSLSTIKYSNDLFWFDIHNINSMEIQKTDTAYIIYIGYDYEEFDIWYIEEISDLLKFQLDSNVLTYIETVPRSGLSIFYNEVIDKYISNGFYRSHEDLIMSSTGAYYLKLIDPTINPIINTILSINGSCWFDEINEIMHYSNWPRQSKILTLNDVNTYGCGPIFYYKTWSTDEETTNIFFLSYSPDLSTVDWEENNSLTGTSHIISSTCVSTNGEDHYIMYFRDNQLEIRDRINGELIHHQESTIIPFTIIRKIDNEILFLEENEDEISYSVFVLDGEIQVSVDDNQIEISSNDLNNYPNPFNPTTTISFSIPIESNIELSIYNIKGQKIRSLLKDQITAGEYSIVWDGEDGFNKPVSSGVYLYKLSVNGKTEVVKKCLLLK